MTKKAIRSVKYGLTYKGVNEASKKDSKSIIIYHTIKDAWDTDCGRDHLVKRLPRKPTGKRYRFCAVCRKQQAKA